MSKVGLLFILRSAILRKGTNENHLCRHQQQGSCWGLRHFDSSPDNDGVDIRGLFRTWKRGTLETHLAAHPELWDEECEQLVRDGHRRESLLEEIVGDARGYHYGMYDQEADGFIQWLIETHGFKRAGEECVEFDLKFGR